MSTDLKYLACILLAGCGRVGFAPVTGDGGAPDATGDATASLDVGLLIRMTFDGSSFFDAGGPATNCAVCPGGVPGRVGQAARFTGTECVEVRDAAGLRPPAFTYAVWARVETAANQNFFGRPSSGATNDINTFEAFADAGNVYHGIGPNFLTAPFAVGEWHHIAGVFDGTTVVGYLDGVAMGSLTTGAAVYGDDDFLVGCDRNFGTLGFFLDGFVDEIRFYDRTLSAAEVAQLATP